MEVPAMMAAPRPPPHRPPPQHRPKQPGRVHTRKAPSLQPKEPWVEYWATSTWPNWAPYRPNAPQQAPYEMHEAARAGIRLMPDQGSLITGLRARVAELEARSKRIGSALHLEAQVKALRAENKRLREAMGTAAQSKLQAELAALKSENAYVKSQCLALAAKLHMAEKELGREL